MMRTTPHCETSRNRWLTLVLVGSLAAGCATAQKKPDLVWPDPPETTRIRLVREIRRQSDIDSSFLGRVRRALLRDDGALAIYGPTGVALDPTERFLYVVGPRKVLRIDRSTGQFSFAATSKEPASPYGVAVDGDGRLYVSDHASALVMVYSKDGAFERKIGDGVLEAPTGITVDRRAHVLYVVSGARRESKKHVVEAFSLKGERLRTIGTRGSKPGEFNFPVNVAAAPDGRIFVTDMLNFRIQVLDSNGTPSGFVGEAGTWGTGRFQKAKGIALDSFGNIHVTDSEGSNVQVFNQNFRPLLTYGGRHIPMANPTGIAIDSKNTIFVADYSLNKILEFQLVNTTQADCVAPEPSSGGHKRDEPQGETAP